MASVAPGASGKEFCWIRDKSDHEPVKGLTKIPGLNAERERKTRSRKMNRRADKAGSGPDKAPAQDPEPSFCSRAWLSSSATPETSDPCGDSLSQAKPSLKDLCPEDKLRIANLIQELARVSEEKEESEQKLRHEQQNFEKTILNLEHQNQLIVQERESLQQQYRECRELLGLYQQHLCHQQQRLNHSISLFHQSHSTATQELRPQEAPDPAHPSLEDWKERRRHLLQQKQRLEAEHQRIHARLAQQERKLQLRDTPPQLDPAPPPLPDARQKDPPPVPPLSLALSSPRSSRLDDSLVELLEVFSPVPDPAWPRTPEPDPALDLEESQILQDIFFIC